MSDDNEPIQWPDDVATIDEVGLLALMDISNLDVRDADGNKRTVRAVGPAFETSVTAEGWSARLVYPDHIVDLEWDEEACQWTEPAAGREGERT